MGFKAYLIEKMQALIGVYYQLHSNRADYFEESPDKLDLSDANPDEVYDN